MSVVIVIAVFLVVVVAIGFGLYSRRGDPIGEQPADGSGGAPGAKRPSRHTGRDEGDTSSLDQRGTAP